MAGTKKSVEEEADAVVALYILFDNIDRIIGRRVVHN